MTKASIYLDCNATCPVRPEAAERVAELLHQPLNASSVHGQGRKARHILEDARETIAQSVSAFAREVIFTASGTEANNMALRSQPSRRLMVSAIEHSSVLKATSQPQLIPVDAHGVIRLDALARMLAEPERPAMVSVMLANNETGVIQPIREVSAICRENRALLHCDAVQALGKMAVNFSDLGADMMSISAHKCGGPPGAAALLVRADLPIASLLTGGGQELGRRAGTENVAAIAGFAAAMQAAQDLSPMQALEAERYIMENTLRQAVPEVVIFGQEAKRLPNTSCVAMPGVPSETQLMALDLAGFAVSAGSACSSGRVTPSHVLNAMGAGAAHTACAIRISAGWHNTKADFEAFTAAWVSLAGRLAGKGGDARIAAQ
jgi:cysteine desulfurase